MKENGVQSVERTFSILEALSQAPSGALLSELSASVGLNKTTVHRLLGSLIELGYASGENGRYRLTVKLFEVGARIVNRLDLLTAARPFLEALSTATGEAVHLVVRDGADIVYIFKEDAGHNSVQMSSRIGLRSPMYCTGVGKAILAALPEPKAEEIWAQSRIIRRTDNTITAFAQLQAQFAGIRSRGYAVDDEENELGVRCIAASILDYAGNAAGAFSISAPSGRMDDARVSGLAPLVLETREKICRALGSVPAED